MATRNLYILIKLYIITKGNNINPFIAASKGSNTYILILKKSRRWDSNPRSFYLIKPNDLRPLPLLRPL
jgi:hypothetical protein